MQKGGGGPESLRLRDQGEGREGGSEGSWGMCGCGPMGVEVGALDPPGWSRCGVQRSGDLGVWTRRGTLLFLAGEGLCRGDGQTEAPWRVGSGAGEGREWGLEEQVGG